MTTLQSKQALPAPSLWRRFASADLRIVLTLALTLFVAFSFWFGSRIPNLDEKAMMGGDSQIESLGFDVVLEVRETDPVYKRVLYTTVNWVDTNKRGMTFGVILAVCLMTLLSLFRRKSFNNGFANAAMGVVIGTPLGVCVNCAAPIAKGLHSAGTRLETTLAAMISSPTMNIIVLTMLFAMFPWYMVFTKLGITLAFIVIGIPILCRILPVSLTATEDQVCELPRNGLRLDAGTEAVTGPLDSVRWVAQTMARHFWYILRTTVPLMLLAGFLGALLIVVLPWSSIAHSLPQAGSTLTTTVVYMTGLAVIGTFLPVPIAFDVIVVAVLMASGMPVKYAMVLLFTLGVFSIYSAQIVWTSISRLMAVVLFGAIIGLGFVAGVAAHYLGVWDEAKQREMMYQVFVSESEPAPREYVPTDPGADFTTIEPALRAAARAPVSVDVLGPDDIEVTRFALRERVAAAGEPLFTRINGEHLGVAESSHFSPLRHLPPQYWGRGVASGDIHNDGWPDLLVVSDNLAFNGLSLYANSNGERFVKQRIEVPALNELSIVTAALVDLDGDGWLDIALSAYRGGTHLIYNRDGQFLAENLVSLPGDAPLSPGLAFGDVDEDGDLDLVTGNWSIGFLHGLIPGERPSSQNLLYRQHDGVFEPEPLPGFPGETLSTLLTDFNDDGHLDLIVGNDFDAADVYYHGDGTGAFHKITTDAGIIPHTTRTTMSIASADLDNDLKPELLLAQTSKGEGANFSHWVVNSREVCEDLEAPAAVDQCVAERKLHAQIDLGRDRRDASMCMEIADAVARQECMGSQVLLAAWKLEDRSLCNLLSERMPRLFGICEDVFAERVQATREQRAEDIYQVEMYNVLLAPNASGGFDDRAMDLGIAVTGWSWNAKFADVDNDEWQDLYVANGLYYSDRREPNFFYANKGGQGFEDRTKESGLLDYRSTAGYTYVDFDADGDLDVISLPAFGPVHVFVNNSTTGNGIVFELRDERGNRAGIGSRVLVRYGPDAGRAQVREIQASGGFISFDPQLAHFGLGEHDRVDSVEVRWSTGETTIVPGPFAANHHYVLRRAAPAALYSDTQPEQAP